MSEKYAAGFVRVGVDMAGPNCSDFSATAIVLPSENMKELALAMLAGANAMSMQSLAERSFVKSYGHHYCEMITYHKASNLLGEIGRKMWDQIKEAEHEQKA